jgi:hypothetical protein
MKERTIVIFTFVILVGLIAGLYLFSDWFSRTTGYILGEGEKQKLVQCLNQKGAIIYGSITCNSCEALKDELGNLLRVVSYRECVNLEGVCGELKKLPALQVEGKLIYDFNNLYQLRESSRCFE